MKDINILIIEDNEETILLMEDILQEYGFKTTSVITVTDGISYITQKKYDIVLLDLNLPDFTGFELLTSIKNRVAIPIIVISAYSDTQTKVKALRFGASDYMVKPIDFEELEARIWAILGRQIHIKFNQKKELFYIDGNENIFFQDEILDLTNIEFQILSLFVKNKNITIKREELNSIVSSSSQKRSLDHHIKNIRKKIKDNGKISKYIKTEYGIGYKLVY